MVVSCQDSSEFQVMGFDLVKDWRGGSGVNSNCCVLLVSEKISKVVT